MEGFLSFLKENWKLIAIAGLIIFSVVLTLCTKHKVNIVTSSILSDAFLKLPSMIHAAEIKFGSGNGKEKFKYVFTEIISFISRESCVSASSVIDMYGETISQQIEKILETPQKKD